MSNILNVLQGYRTYLVGAGFIIAGVVDMIDGNPGLEKILQGLGFIFTRNAIASIR